MTPWRENIERVRVPGLTAQQHAALDALTVTCDKLDRARLDAACRSIEWQSRAEAAERRYTYTDPSGRKYDWDEHPHTGACRASHNTECWGHARALRAILRAEAAEQRAEELNAENASLNAENRDLLEKWSARGAQIEELERERDELDGRLSNAISALSDADGDRGRFIARAEKAERALAEIAILARAALSPSEDTSDES